MRVLMFALIGVLLSLQAWADVPVPKLQELAEPSYPRWMQMDVPLQAKVTMEAKGRPLYVVLSALTHNGNVELSVARDIREYRVSIHAQSQPLWKIMARLQNLFGHGKSPNVGYEWIRETAKDKTVHYYFQRNARAVEEEAALLNFPAAAAKRWLRATRDYLRLSPKDRKKFVSDSPRLQTWAKNQYDSSHDLDNLPQQAIGVLTDAQIEQLAQTGQVDVPQYALSSISLDWLRRNASPNTAGPNTDISLPPSDAQLRLEAETQDQLQGVYSVALSFRKGFPNSCPYSYVMDTLGAFDTWEEQQSVKPDIGPGQPVDMLAHENALPNARPILSVTNALALLTREAKLTIYAEAFVKGKKMLYVTKGKPEYLLSKICTTFGYRWCKVGGDYLVYDRLWAQDRAADIPQTLLNPWLASLHTHGGALEPADCLDMARHLNDLQFKTIHAILSKPLFSRQSDLDALRVAALSEPNFNELHSTEAQITEATETNLPLLQKVLRSKQIVFPVRVHCKLETQQVGTLKSYSYLITIKDQKGAQGGGYLKLGEQNLADMPLATPLQ